MKLLLEPEGEEIMVVSLHQNQQYLVIITFFSLLFLGMICRTTKKIVIYRAPSKRSKDLIPIILQHSNIGATIISDQAAMYVNSRTNASLLEQYGFNHYWVNHSIEYVNSENSAIHTNNIERVWRSLKSFISHIKRPVSETILDGYIDSFVLKYNVGDEIFGDVILSIFSHYYTSIKQISL